MIPEFKHLVKHGSWYKYERMKKIDGPKKLRLRTPSCMTPREAVLALANLLSTDALALDYWNAL